MDTATIAMVTGTIPTPTIPIVDTGIIAIIDTDTASNRAAESSDGSLGALNCADTSKGLRIPRIQARGAAWSNCLENFYLVL